MNLIDTLSMITADLLEFEENELFLERLFQLESGVWVDLDCLCNDLDGYQDLRKALRKSLQERVRVTWLEYPDSRYGEGYCLIVFFAEDQQWHNVALYNKQRFTPSALRTNGALFQLA